MGLREAGKPDGRMSDYVPTPFPIPGDENDWHLHEAESMQALFDGLTERYVVAQMWQTTPQAPTKSPSLQELPWWNHMLEKIYGVAIRYFASDPSELEGSPIARNYSTRVQPSHALLNKDSLLSRIGGGVRRFRGEDYSAVQSDSDYERGDFYIEGDVVGPWMFEDLAKLISELKYCSVNIGFNRPGYSGNAFTGLPWYTCDSFINTLRARWEISGPGGGSGQDLLYAIKWNTYSNSRGGIWGDAGESIQPLDYSYAGGVGFDGELSAYVYADFDPAFSVVYSTAASPQPFDVMPVKTLQKLITVVREDGDDPWDVFHYAGNDLAAIRDFRLSVGSEIPHVRSGTQCSLVRNEQEVFHYATTYRGYFTHEGVPGPDE